AANIEIAGDGVEIHDFTIESPDAAVGYYSSGLVIGGDNVEIHANTFRTASAASLDDISQALQTYRDAANPTGGSVDGLNIHGNTFESSGTGVAGYEAIFINHTSSDPTPTGQVVIDENTIGGAVIRAITTERSNTVISNNAITTSLVPKEESLNAGEALQGILVYDFSQRPQQDVTVNGNTIGGEADGQGFSPDIQIGGSGQSIANTGVSGNTGGVDIAGEFVGALSGTSGNDKFTISGGGGTGSITYNAGDGDDTLILDFGSGNPIPDAGVGNPGLVYNGEGGNDDLVLRNGSFTDAIFGFDSENDGLINLDGAIVQYTGLEPITSTVTATNVYLNYGSTGETITVSDAGVGQMTVDSTAGESITFNSPSALLEINAGAGNDTVELISLGNASGITTFSVNGQDGADTLTGRDVASTWTIGSTSTYSDGTTTLSFGTVEVLQGGTATDAFNVSVASALTLKGGAGIDTFQVSSPGSVATIEGGAGLDALTLLGGTVGTYTGGADDATIDFSGDTVATTVTLSGSKAGSGTNVTTFTGVSGITGAGAADIIEGTAGVDAFVVNGANDGTVQDIAFADFGVLRGLGGGDTFAFTDSGTLGGDIVGGDGNDEVVGDADGNAFVVTGANTGTLSGKTTGWSQIENLTGGAGADTFTFDDNATLSGAADGDGGTDVLDFSAYTSDVAFSITGVGSLDGIAGTGVPITNGFDNMNTFSLPSGGGSDTLTINGTSGDDVISVGPGTIGLGAIAVSVAGVESIVVNGGDGSDTLSVDFASSNPIPSGGLTFNGQDGTTDSMEFLAGVGFTTVTYVFTNAADGTVSFDGSTLTYTGLEPITDNLVVANRVFTFGALADSITLAAGTVNDGISEIASPTAETVAFLNPTSSLTINTGTGADSLGGMLDSAGGVAFALPISVNAGADLTLNEMATAGDLSVTSAASIAVDQVSVGPAATLTLSAAGAIAGVDAADDVADVTAGHVVVDAATSFGEGANTLDIDADDTNITASGNVTFDVVGTGGHAVTVDLSAGNVLVDGRNEAADGGFEAITLTSVDTADGTVDVFNYANGITATLVDNADTDKDVRLETVSSGDISIDQILANSAADVALDAAGAIAGVDAADDVADVT
ncbi:MAG: hypothetical protein HN406_24585, partial [Lentisphaerae bacterium]|nr:hypothetical protein [Lentisphaerota bacterium]